MMTMSSWRWSRGSAWAAGLLLAVLAGGEAGAQGWSGVASTCAVDESDAANYEVSAARFKHLGASTGSIYTRCNVTNPRDDGQDPGWNLLEVFFKDPDGTQTAYTIEVVVYQVQYNGGITEMGRFNSNDDGANLTTDQVASSLLDVSHWDFLSRGYFVQIRVTRPAGATLYPSVSLARLLFNII